MADVVWLTAALEDLEGIAEYIALDSPAFASTVVQKAMSVSRDLADFPRLGRRVPEWDEDTLHQQLFYGYRLIYRIQPEKVVVLAVVHGARLLPDDLADRE